MTKTVQVGSLKLGGGNPVLVQSMTNTDTRDTEATLKQIRALAAAGCDIVRVSVYDEACARAVRTLVDGSPVGGGERHRQAADQPREHRRGKECA